MTHYIMRLLDKHHIAPDIYSIRQLFTHSKTVRLFASLCIAGAALALCPDAGACTSMIIGAKASASGRPMLWKNRDTGNTHNFVERVPSRRPGELSYVGLFNSGDSLLREAWMGMNEAGFAIMNTASYNLAPDTAKFKDQEGCVMSRALQVCRTVDDFARLLDTLPKPLGVQANFGVIDAQGNGAYFETDDYTYRTFYLRDTDNDVLVRTNYSETGNDTDGMGYIRCANARHILADRIAGGGFVPEDFTERASRSFYHSLLGHDFETDTVAWAVDQDFIPRLSTSASVVIEGVQPGHAARGVNDRHAGKSAQTPVMWTLMGYPPTGHVDAAFVDSVPEALRPVLPGWRSPASEESMRLRQQAFPIERGSGHHYIDMRYVRAEQQRQRLLSKAGYAAGRRLRR